jgi:aminoglycoside phosphotransferase (APT) family kinase protein
MSNEARTMEFVRSHGYPVPAVASVSEDGYELVMERVDGPTMANFGVSRPWLLRRLGSQLAELHESLHALPTPDWLNPAPCGDGSQLLHLDLHPLNVLMSAKGPVVIDWTNAAVGAPAVDVVLTWILCVSGDAPMGRLERVAVDIGRSLFVKSFLKRFDEEERLGVLREVVEWKCRDAHMREIEIARMRLLVTTYADRC